MKFLNRLRNAEINSAVIRALLHRCYAEGEIYTVPFGFLRGCKLRYHERINYHAMLGLWEPENFRFLTRTLVEGGLLRQDSIACDVGANIGLFSLWLSRWCVPNGHVYAFEAAPDTFEDLEDTMALNNATNVHLEPLACSDRCGSVEFFLGFHHHVSSLNAAWAAGERGQARKIAVDSTTLDDFFFGPRSDLQPSFIKMDIEGGGVFALQKCERCVQARPYFLIESHTPEEDRAISNLVMQGDYAAFRLNNHKWVSAPQAVHPDPAGIWGTLFLCPQEKKAVLTELLA
ncbi:MAG TPA: FkbM family methyltransferase [Verrucomicrobiae bacterium]|nr:FkbM family methyltransferase [Verrucomicrobiae bacterium]